MTLCPPFCGGRWLKMNISKELEKKSPVYLTSTTSRDTIDVGAELLVPTTQGWYCRKAGP